MPSHTHKTLILLALVGCFSYQISKARVIEKEAPQEQPPADTSRPYVIFPYDTTYLTNFPHAFAEYQPTELSENEIDSCYQLMAPLIAAYNKNYKHDTIHLPDYYFQYVPALSRKGEKVVFINAVCHEWADWIVKTEPGFNWRKRLIETEDGGKCFFCLVVLLSQNKALRLSVNGPHGW